MEKIGRDETARFHASFATTVPISFTRLRSFSLRSRLRSSFSRASIAFPSSPLPATIPSNKLNSLEPITRCLTLSTINRNPDVSFKLSYSCSISFRRSFGRKAFLVGRIYRALSMDQVESSISLGFEFF